MNFLQLKLIFDSFSRSSFLVAISASTLQDGTNESPKVCCVHMALVNRYAVHPRRSLSNGEPGGVGDSSSKVPLLKLRSSKAIHDSLSDEIHSKEIAG